MYFLQGMSPYTTLNLKIKPKPHDPIDGNEFLQAALGKQDNFQYCQFKAFFDVQHHIMTVPPHNHLRNLKFDSFFKCIKYISIQVWNPDKYLACDEKTISFKVQHVDKIRINFRKAGYWFQDDALSDDG